MRYLSSFSILLFLFSVSHLSHAQTWLGTQSEFEQVWTQGRRVWMLDLENDSLLLKRDDGFYTSGNHLAIKRLWRDTQQEVQYGFQIGQDLYTASNINLRPHQLSRYDHPYAGWLYFGASRQHRLRDGSMRRVSLDIGCLGPCAAGEWTQTHLHRLLKQPLPQAWSTQLKQEWGVVLQAEAQSAAWPIRPDFESSVGSAVRIGNIFTDLRTYWRTRWGQLSPFNQQNAQYFFTRAELRAVVYNATLQGGYFQRQSKDIHPRKIVPELEIGHQWQTPNWTFTASVIRRGSEIKELPQAVAAQNFAKLQLNYAY